MAGNQPYPPQYAPPQSAPPPGYATPGESLDPGQPAPIVIHVVEPQTMTMTIEHDEVPDNMIISIISMFFCLILGIIATFMANRANNTKYKPGGLGQAKQDAETANKLAIAGIIVGCFLTIIVPILIFVAGGVTLTKFFDFFEELGKEPDLKDSLIKIKQQPTIDEFRRQLY